ASRHPRPHALAPRSPATSPAQYLASIPLRSALRSIHRVVEEAMDRQMWRRRVTPSCARQAQEAMAQLRARGIRANLQRDWFALDLLVDEDEEIDELAAGMLDRVWRSWRECLAEQRASDKLSAD